MQFLIYNLISFLILFFLFFFRENICLKLKLIDYPNNDSIHKHQALLFGGIFLICSLILNIFFLILTDRYENNFFSFFLVISFFSNRRYKRSRYKFKITSYDMCLFN